MQIDYHAIATTYLFSVWLPKGAEILEVRLDEAGDFREPDAPYLVVAADPHAPTEERHFLTLMRGMGRVEGCGRYLGSYRKFGIRHVFEFTPTPNPEPGHEALAEEVWLRR